MEPDGMEQLQVPEKPAESALVERSAPIETVALAGDSAPPLRIPHAPPGPRAVAPVWHTVALVLVLLGLSFQSASSLSLLRAPVSRLQFYAITAATDLLLLGWVLLGLRLRRVSLRAILGGFSFRPHALAVDLSVAVVFWFGALIVLGSLGAAWNSVESAVTHRPPPVYIKGQPLKPAPSQEEALRAIKLLAPQGAGEVAAWAVFCLLIGFVEETVFRGYLQRQFIALARGNESAGVVLAAVLFGCAHAYQGARNMVILSFFGAMFGVLALKRRSLRAGMMTHSWHDFFVGIVIMLARSMHLI